MNHLGTKILKPEYYQWAIVPVTIGGPIGSIAVAGYDSRLGQPELGYCIGKKWWRQGYTSEALDRVIDFLFDEAGAVPDRGSTRSPQSGFRSGHAQMRHDL